MFALLLLWPAVAFAFHISPTHWPLGPLPFWTYWGLWEFGWVRVHWFDLFIGPIMLAAETLVLWAWMRQLGVLGNLWRAALLYIVGRVSETAVVACLWAIGLPVGLSNWPPEVFGTLAVCLLAGWAGKLGAARFLYRRAGFHVRELVVPVAVATAAGYVSALSLILAFSPDAARNLLYIIEHGWR